MPATKQPVANRSGNAVDGPWQAATSPLTAAAPTEAVKNTGRAGTGSARLVTAETSAPATKPSCTAMVSQAASVGDSAHSARSCGSTADAENQVVIDRTIAAASRLIPADRMAAAAGSHCPQRDEFARPLLAGREPAGSRRGDPAQAVGSPRSSSTSSRIFAAG